MKVKGFTSIREAILRLCRPMAGMIALIVAACAAGTPTAGAQSYSLKTNILYDAFLNVNIGAEAQIARRWSIDASADMNFWTLSQGEKWRHWFVQPELRYWLCEATGGHFFGLHLHGGQYNMANWKHGFMMLGTNFHKLEKYRYQGWFAGAGIAYGYSWLLGRHWAIEAEIGIGWAYTRYDVFPCSGCGRKIAADRHHNYVGPTKAAVNLVYTF